MGALDPRIPGIVILASSAAFVILKRWTTGSFLKGKPEGGFALWFMHVFNLIFLTAVTPAVAILMAARRWETLDPTIVPWGKCRCIWASRRSGSCSAWRVTPSWVGLW